MMCSVQLILDCRLLPVYARFGTMSLYHHIQNLAVALCFHSPFNHIASRSSIHTARMNLQKKRILSREKHCFKYMYKVFEGEKTKVK